MNPDDNNLMNDGVVNINTSRDENGLRIIRHEIRTFVCEGEYERGINRILDTYLRHIEEPKQPAVWVSGFFGSGKSHLIKMLGYFWEDFKFPTGETARNIKSLPPDVRERLVELDRKQHIYGRLSISGTLKDFPSNDIRYSFLQLMLSALGLPQQYHHYKFVYWAKLEGIYDSLKALVNNQGKNFEKELENMFVSSTLANALLQLKPEFAENEAKVKEAFRAQFKRVESIDRQQLISTIKNEVLPMFYGEHIPCTIIVLDEVQQFIGVDGNKTIDIQNLAQDICDNFNGKLLLVGSGQHALNETPQLQPLKDRFSVTVNLTNTDVETVTRKTVLEKKPANLAQLTEILEIASGEISRNLSGSDFAYRQEDRLTLTADYPILPSTRKFWKKILQVVDTAGTSGQLRSQLRIVNDSIKQVSDKPVGSIIPADFIFFQKQQQLLQHALLLNETNNLIAERLSKEGDSQLEGRILSMVFLLDLLPKDLAGGRLKSNESTIADLLLDDLNHSSDLFRTKIKALVKKLVEEKILMPVDDEYKLQTKVGAEWEQEFKGHVIKLQGTGEDEIYRLRKDKLSDYIKSKTNPINILQGISRERREFELWDKQDRPRIENRLNVWIRDGWSENQNNVINEIRAEGTESPLIYIYINKLRDQDLRSELIKFLAAQATLKSKVISEAPEAIQARKSMETRKGLASNNISELIDTIASEAKVYLAGGSIIDSASLGENVKDALESAADRQYTDFKKADYTGWGNALQQAIGKNPEALKRIQFNGETKDHPMAIEILRYIGNQSKTGKDIRNNFMKAPYGWNQDAIDTILLMLLLTNHLSSSEPEVRPNNINANSFKKEIHILEATDKINLRKLYQAANINCKPGEEFIYSNTFLNQLKELAYTISGEPPLLEPINVQFLKEIENLDSNERLLRIVEESEDLKEKHKEWQRMAELAKSRMPQWKMITELSHHLPSQSDQLRADIDGIRDGRLLYNEPDSITPLLGRIASELNDLLHKIQAQFIATYDKHMSDLQENEYFSKLNPEQKYAILGKNQLHHQTDIKKLEPQALLNHLNKLSLDTWQTKIAALPGQFQSVLDEAIKLSAPKAEIYSLPKRTLHSEAEIDSYVDEVKIELKELIKKAGSVILK